MVRVLNFKPRPAAFANGEPLPRRNLLSKIFFQWMTPILVIGASRPLEIDDLWTLELYQQAQELGGNLERNFYERVPPSKRPTKFLPDGYQPPPKPSKPDELPEDLKIAPGDVAEASNGKKAPEEEDLSTKAKTVTEDGKKYDSSLLLALNKTLFWRFWSAGIFCIIANVGTSTVPLVSQLLLTFIEDSYYYTHGTSSTPPPSIGYGIGVAFGIWGMQQISSLCNNHFQHRAMVSGFLARSALIANVSRKSVRLSNAARLKHSNGQLVTHVSADASFLDMCGLLSHDLYVQPIVVLIGLGILIKEIGYSGLVGFAVLVAGMPLQAFLFGLMIQTRQTQMKITDQRVRLLQEVYNGIRTIKLYAYEAYFGERVQAYRRQEMEKLRKNCVARATMNSMVSFLPILAAVLSFITYAATGHTLTVAKTFSALQAFNNITFPLRILPLAVQNLSDAYVGLQRISNVMLADEIADPIPIQKEAKFAVSLHGSATWETAEKPSSASGPMGPPGRDRHAKKNAKKAKKAAAEAQKIGLETLSKENVSKAKPFALNNIDLDIPRGAFVVICGRVGSGKSSLIQTMIGEMRLTSGTITLGGTTSYFQQLPWTLNDTLRNNILFGDVEPDEARFRLAINSCALKPDIAMLSHGLLTEIGERGINLSGGQKARVSLARCVYANADTLLLDDPLSAVDAHVSKTLVESLTTGELASKTRILVTHHLDVMPLADMVITLEDGRIVEQGSYADLMDANGPFRKLMDEHIGESAESDEPAEKNDEEEIINLQEEKSQKHLLTQQKLEDVEDGIDYSGSKGDAEGAAIMQKEERNIGAVGGHVYVKYAASMGSAFNFPGFMLLLLMAQAANVSNTVFLGYWSANEIPGWSQNKYMLVYAMIGLAYAVFTFLGTLLLFVSGVTASFHLFNAAFAGTMRAKVSWHDSTPIGRIISRLSKDIMVLDDQITMQYNQLITNGLGVVGTIALVFYSFPYLGIIFVVLIPLYMLLATFYRNSSREVKRIDSNMRSFIYASFGEMLNGMSSIRAYRVEQRFLDKTEKAVNVENQAYFMTITLQRWLSIRLDIFGNILVLCISMFGVGFRNTISPSKLGVCLTYCLSVTQTIGMLVNTVANVEQDMNTAERVQHYSDLPAEAAARLSNDPSPSWPERGAIEFKDVHLKYREDLPEVLKGTTFSVKHGESIGVVGRTGAGKSSLLTCLFRIVEISGGCITIDGRDIKTVGLDSLRKKLSIVPQDPLLWQGTVRSNLDPEGEHTDQELYSALQRTHLLASADASQEVRARLEKFKLDSQVQDEGNNFSAGERQLVALARALVRNSKIVVLDEASSAIDLTTDAALQNTIREEFRETTLLCIAHRLATIAFYDRVMVMDQGCVVEFDTPLALYDQEGSLFRALCDKAELTRDAIIKIRGEDTAELVF